MPMPIGPWARIEVFMRGDGKEWSNLFYFTSTGFGFPGSPTDFPGIGTGLAGNLIIALATFLPNAYTTLGARVTINDSVQTVGVDVNTSLSGGDGSANALPEDVAIVVQRISAHPGKTGRGRVYLSSVGEDQATGSYVNAAGATNIIGLIAAMTAVITIGGNIWTPAVFSKKNSAFYDITFCQFDSQLGTMRSRRTKF